MLTCSIAETTICCILSKRKYCFSVRLLMSGIISVTPISVIFSSSHSNLPAFLRSEMATHIFLAGCCLYCFSVTLTMHCLRSGFMIVACSKFPFPPLVKGVPGIPLSDARGGPGSPGFWETRSASAEDLLAELATAWRVCADSAREMAQETRGVDPGGSH